MGMSYVEALGVLEDEVDRAVNRAINSGLTIDEAVKELRRIADVWEEDRG